LHNHEKTAFLKFFVTYFASVAPLILIAGFFYYLQMKNHLLKTEEFSLIEYARHIKMDENLSEYASSYHHKFIKNNKHIDIRNFTVTKNEFSKMVPMNRYNGYLQLFKSKKEFNEKLLNWKFKIITIQLLLLLFFAYISYRLAKNALKPLQESIATLDKFAKDLIHDLNTPVTSIKLNMKLLEKSPNKLNESTLQRIKKSVETISELHENLTILLQEETFQFQEINICKVVEEIVQIQKQIYPDIRFHIECSTLNAKINQNAIKQILQNIISNACKYNKPNGYVKIYSVKNLLYIQNSGTKIENPQKIFNRSYSSDKHSSGIGLDIVNRLAHAMNIQLKVESETDKNTFILTMP